MSARRSTLAFVLAGLAVSLLVGMVVANFASSDPDGLESAVIKAPCEGDEACLEEAAGEAVYDAAPLPDYENTPLSGLVGTLATFAVAGGLVVLLTRGRSRPRDPDRVA